MQLIDRGYWHRSFFRKPKGMHTLWAWLAPLPIIAQYSLPDFDICLKMLTWQCKADLGLEPPDKT